MHVGTRVPSITLPWYIWYIWISLGIILILLCVTVMCINEKQMAMYKQEIQEKEYEKRIAMYKKQMDDQQEIQGKEYEKRIAMCKKQMDDQQIEYERQIAVLNEKQNNLDREIATCEEKLVISNHMDVINGLRLMKCETRRLTDQYVYNIEKYYQLKTIDDSYTWSLTTEQRCQMHKLRYYLGLGENYEIPDWDSVTDMVKLVSEDTLDILSFYLEILEGALGEINIKKMRKLQMDENIMNLPIFIKNQFENIKLGIISSSREIQARGVLYQISIVFCDHLLPTISKIAVSVATNVINHMIL